AHRVLPGSAAGHGVGDQGFQDGPLLVGQVAGVSLAAHAACCRILPLLEQTLNRICCPPPRPRKGVGHGQKRILKTKEPTMTTTSYRAVQASKPGRLEVAERELTAPPPGKVRICVEACGVCHSDSGTVEGQFPIDWPRVPGHELVGRIDALGSGVQGWA